uniref:Uncharacterized protein n=1 Tax=Globisporangium ultimum (strain ATCC 200006 / CBS 805.95 / DAOM BR144) TaxID=431595 RepID=K3WVJ2_GLOUD
MLEHGDLPTADDVEEVSLPESIRLFVRVRINSKIRVRPTIQSSALVPKSLDTNEFEVSVMVTNWMCVVVPGYGCGWVKSESVISRRSTSSLCASDTEAASEPSIVGLKVKALECMEGRMASNVLGVKLLLQTIGFRLKGLSLPFHDLTNDDLREVLVVCPSLTHLNIVGNKVTDILVLVDRYRANQCKIAYLNLRSLCNEETAIVGQLAEMLADPLQDLYNTSE